jgi:hypothetical protein
MLRLLVLLVCVAVASAVKIRITKEMGEEHLADHLHKTRLVHKVFANMIEVAAAQKQAHVSNYNKGFKGEDQEEAKEQAIGMELPAGVDYSHVLPAMMHHMAHNEILQKEIAKHPSFIEKMARLHGKKSGKSKALLRSGSGTGGGSGSAGAIKTDGTQFMAVLKESLKSMWARIKRAAESVGSCLGSITPGDAWQQFQEITLGIGISLPGLTFGLPIAWGPFTGDTTEYGALKDTALASSDNGLVSTSLQAEIGSALTGMSISAGDVSSFYGTAAAEMAESDDEWFKGGECIFGSNAFKRAGGVTDSVMDAIKSTLFGADYKKNCEGDEYIKKGVKFFVSFANPAVNGAAFGFTNTAHIGGACDTYLGKQWILWNLLKAIKAKVAAAKTAFEKALGTTDGKLTGKPKGDVGSEENKMDADPAKPLADSSDPQQMRTLADPSGAGSSDGMGSEGKDAASKTLDTAVTTENKPTTGPLADSDYVVSRAYMINVSPICPVCVLKSKTYTCQMTAKSNFFTTMKNCATALLKAAMGALKKMAAKLKDMGEWVRTAYKAGKSKFCRGNPSLIGFGAKLGIVSKKCADAASGAKGPKKLLLLEESAGLRARHMVATATTNRELVARVMAKGPAAVPATIKVDSIWNCDTSGGYSNCMKVSASAGYEVTFGLGVPTATLNFGVNVNINLWKVLLKIVGAAKSAAEWTAEAVKESKWGKTAANKANSVLNELEAQQKALMTKKDNVKKNLMNAIWTASSDFMTTPFTMVASAVAAAKETTKKNPRTFAFIELDTEDHKYANVDKMYQTSEHIMELLEETFQMEREGHEF